MSISRRRFEEKGTSEEEDEERMASKIIAFLEDDPDTAFTLAEIVEGIFGGESLARRIIANRNDVVRHVLGILEEEGEIETRCIDGEEFHILNE